MDAEKSVSDGRGLTIRFTESKDEVDKHLNKTVLADAVEQIAIENNERAVALRDAGKTKEAKDMLGQNVYYLRSNAGKLDSKKLEGYATENELDYDNLDEENWGR